MGQKDIVEKSLEDYDDVFSDIVNALVFEGKRAVKPRELRTVKVRSQYKADDGKLHEEERDNAKYWKKGKVKIALLGREMVDIPPGMENYVNDYKIHIIEVAYLTEEQVKLFRSDFRIIADYFVQKRKNKKYIPSRRTIRHVDAVLKFMSVMTGDERFSEVQKAKKTGGNQTMCVILDQIENRGIEKGKELMRAEKDAVIAEKDAALSEKDAVIAKKDAVIAEKDTALSRAMELLRKNNIAFVS